MNEANSCGEVEFGHRTTQEGSNPSLASLKFWMGKKTRWGNFIKFWPFLAFLFYIKNWTILKLFINTMYTMFYEWWLFGKKKEVRHCSHKHCQKKSLALSWSQTHDLWFTWREFDHCTVLQMLTTFAQNCACFLKFNITTLLLLDRFNQQLSFCTVHL